MTRSFDAPEWRPDPPLTKIDTAEWGPQSDVGFSGIVGEIGYAAIVNCRAVRHATEEGTKNGRYRGQEEDTGGDQRQNRQDRWTGPSRHSRRPAAPLPAHDDG